MSDLLCKPLLRISTEAGHEMTRSAMSCREQSRQNAQSPLSAKKSKFGEGQAPVTSIQADVQHSIGSRFGPQICEKRHGCLSIELVAIGPIRTRSEHERQSMPARRFLSQTACTLPTFPRCS